MVDAHLTEKFESPLINHRVIVIVIEFHFGIENRSADVEMIVHLLSILFINNFTDTKKNRLTAFY